MPKAAAKPKEYAIEQILENRINDKSQLQYLIKWKDCPASENSWQLAGDLFSKKKSPSELPTDKNAKEPQTNTNAKESPKVAMEISLSDSESDVST